MTVNPIGKIRNNGIEVDMSVEQAILEAVRTLPFDKQQEILNHATRLRDEAASKTPFQSIEGILANRGISVSAEDIDEADARWATAAGDPIFVSAITIGEIQYLVEKRRLRGDDQRMLVAAVDDVRNPARLVPIDRAVGDALRQIHREEVPRHARPDYRRLCPITRRSATEPGSKDPRIFDPNDPVGQSAKGAESTPSGHISPGSSNGRR
jgi:predicted nucleic acid-binding protein